MEFGPEWKVFKPVTGTYLSCQAERDNQSDSGHQPAREQGQSIEIASRSEGRPVGGVSLTHGLPDRIRRHRGKGGRRVELRPVQIGRQTHRHVEKVMRVGWERPVRHFAGRVGRKSPEMRE
jgi:hypothetical protein